MTASERKPLGMHGVWTDFGATLCQNQPRPTRCNNGMEFFEQDSFVSSLRCHYHHMMSQSKLPSNISSAQMWLWLQSELYSVRAVAAVLLLLSAELIGKCIIFYLGKSILQLCLCFERLKMLLQTSVQMTLCVITQKVNRFNSFLFWDEMQMCFFASARDCIIG